MPLPEKLPFFQGAVALKFDGTGANRTWDQSPSRARHGGASRAGDAGLLVLVTQLPRWPRGKAGEPCLQRTESRISACCTCFSLPVACLHKVEGSNYPRPSSQHQDLHWSRSITQHPQRQSASHCPEEAPSCKQMCPGALCSFALLSEGGRNHEPCNSLSKRAELAQAPTSHEHWPPNAVWTYPRRVSGLL